jgi:hypothetical protein
MVERLWRSVKYEEVYIKDYRSVAELVQGLKAYFEFYNHGSYNTPRYVVEKSRLA